MLTEILWLKSLNGCDVAMTSDNWSRPFNHLSLCFLQYPFYVVKLIFIATKEISGLHC